MPVFIGSPLSPSKINKRNPPTYYAVYCADGDARFSRNPVGGEVLQFDSIADRAQVIDRINAAHRMEVNCAAWPVKAKEAGRYVNLRNYFDESHEEIYYTSPDGWMCIHYRSQLITH